MRSAGVREARQNLTNLLEDVKKGREVVIDPSLNWGSDDRAQDNAFNILGLPVPPPPPIPGAGVFTDPMPGEAPKAKASATRALKKFPVMMHDPIPLGDTPPRAVSDVSLSRRHHLEAAARDLRHMKDHEASRKKHLAEAKVRGKQLGR